MELPRDPENKDYWVNNPYILFNADTWTRFIPTKKMSRTQKLNALARYTIYLTLFLYYLKPDTNYLWIAIIGLLMNIVLYKYSIQENKVNTTEKFFEDLNPPGCRLPSKNNIFMNTPVTEFNTPHLDPCFISNPEISKKVEQEFYNDMYQDVDDIYNRNNNERQFFAMPSTMDYAGQKVLGEWLYNDGGSCKNDQSKCLKYVQPIGFYGL